MSSDFDRAADFLRGASRVAVLTGAGVSAESGVPTFRASDGLREGHAIEDVATPAGYRRDPLLVWRFYNTRRENVGKVKPNPGHHALAAMEKRWGDGFTLITQNVDGLHFAAGNRNVLELHGSLYRTRCPGCGEVRDRGLEPLGDRPTCPTCSGPVRPDIVWFTEPLPGDVLRKAERAAATCDVLLVVGTSAVVYPAAGVIPIAKQRRTPAAVIECNLTQTDASALADVGLYGPSGETLPKLMELL